MAHKIEKDFTRFKQIVRGKIKKELRRYITKGELLGKKGKNLVSIPLPQIQLPRFKYGSQQQGGVGQGEGEVGQPIGRDGQPSTGPGAGDTPGEHMLEVDVELSELAKILGEELELPHIQPRGKKAIASEKDRFTGIHRAGPESLRHFKRTYKQALRRTIALGLYDPDDPKIVPVREDKRYRSWKTHKEPEANAVIIYMMDVSGSMGFEQKEIVRIESFWIDTWLRSQYRNIESRYMVHDATAKEVDQHTFFHIRESGGTKISSAYELCGRLIDERFPPEEWNIYPFHFSDGDNWGGDDTRHCVELLEQKILPRVNVFCYGQVKSAYGSGQFVKDLKGAFKEDERIILSEIASRDEIYDSIKAFLGKGRQRLAFQINRRLPDDLAKAAHAIKGFAKAYGLDFWDIIFEVLDYDELNEVAAYGGFPTRYPHWKFGMEYEQLSKGYSYGLQKIYELVINNDPCYVYLMKSNSMVDQKLVMAHVCGHADFFKNNFWFRQTNRKMMDEMANHGTRMRRYAERFGHENVETFVDCCLSIDNLIDMHSPFVKRRRPKVEEVPGEEEEPRVPRRLRSKDYMDRFVNPPEFLEEQRRQIAEEIEKQKSFPEEPERDVLLFLIEHAPLERWQRDVLSMIREEPTILHHRP